MRPVSIANRHPRLRLETNAVVRLVHVLDAAHATLATRQSVLENEGELSIVFLTDRTLAKLHDEFLEDPTITDVITFEGMPALGTAGEICVSADAALRHLATEPDAARRPAKSDSRLSAAHAEAFSRELTLYVVHGWLHLAGYDDLAPAKKRVMRRAEARAMALLAKQNALPHFRLK
jgi:probable rRNA maturation factor